MTDKAGSSAGGLVGLVLALLVVGVIVGTPLYLGNFQADERALDAAVLGDVEAVRRVVLNLDEHLSVMSDVYDSQGEEARPDKKAMRELLAANASLLDQAKGIVQSFSSVSQGRIYASDHLAVNRIEAILYLSAGKISHNRAEFEQHLARALWREAEQRVDGIAALNRSAELAIARKPTEALAKIEERSLELEATLKALQAGISNLESVIAAKEARVTQLESEIAEARRSLAELDGQDLPFAKYRSAYVKLSDAARAAEAEAASLRNGSLAGATLVLDEGEDLLNAVYEGGTPELGTRDLDFGVELLGEQVAVVEQMKAGLAEQRATFEGLIVDLDSEKDETLAKAETLREEIEALLDRADRHVEAAKGARRGALTAFKLARDYAGLAVTAAKKRTRDAGTALSELGDAVDERLERVKKDGDTEAALHCLRAEIAYNIALTRLNEMNAMQEKHDTEAFTANIVGGEEPAKIGPELDAFRSEAAEQLVLAVDSLKESRNRIKGTTVKASDGTTISGNNYLWQIDIGEAAIHLLQANLAADRPQRLEAQRMAYELLTEAAQDREQSPLLSPAIDTLQYLQRTAR